APQPGDEEADGVARGGGNAEAPRQVRGDRGGEDAPGAVRRAGRDPRVDELVEAASFEEEIGHGGAAAVPPRDEHGFDSAGRDRAGGLAPVRGGADAEAGEDFRL